MSGVSTKSLATDRLNVMEITKMVASHCDDTCTAFRTEPPLTKEVLDCAVTNFFPAGLGDMFSRTKKNDKIVCKLEPMNRVCPWNKSFRTKFQTEPVRECSRASGIRFPPADLCRDPQDHVRAA
jgi:hypothetical protein